MISAIPYILYFAVINLGGIGADQLQNRRILSTLNTRRLAMILGSFFNSFSKFSFVHFFGFSTLWAGVVFVTDWLQWMWPSCSCYHSGNTLHWHFWAAIFWICCELLGHLSAICWSGAWHWEYVDMYGWCNFPYHNGKFLYLCVFSVGTVSSIKVLTKFLS